MELFNNACERALQPHPFWCPDTRESNMAKLLKLYEDYNWDLLWVHRRCALEWVSWRDQIKIYPVSSGP